MNLLFIQGGSRVRVCNNEKMYVDSNFNNDIWKRYKSYCSNLTVILRKSNSLFDEEKLKYKFNEIDSSLMNLVLVDDVYSPKKNFFNIKLKKQIKKQIEDEVKKADKIIIRSIGNYYTNTALKACKKYNKSYLIEVTGFAFWTLWYHSIFGKIVAIPRELYLRRNIKKAPYALYVTGVELQKQYPCRGQSIGCSDVQLPDADSELIINKRRKNKENNNSKIIIGTAAFLDSKFKGQKSVIKALSLLKKEGIKNIEYQLIGSGTGKSLSSYAKKLNVIDMVKIIGPIEHEKVFDWFDAIDIYIHPSYQEGLCRSIIEAMSRGCLILAAKVGGNVELVDDKFLFNKGDYKSIHNLLKRNMSREKILNEGINNINFTKKYNKILLDKKRDDFYHQFMNNK